MKFKKSWILIILVLVFGIGGGLYWYVTEIIGSRAGKCINAQLQTMENIPRIDNEIRCEVLIEGMNDFNQCYREVGESALIPYSIELLEFYIKYVYGMDIEVDNQKQMEQLRMMCSEQALTE